MKKLLILICLVFIFSTACAFNVKVPYVDINLKQPESSVKTPVRVAVIIPDEKYVMTKTVHPGSGISVAYAVPFGLVLKKSSSEILPNFFEKVEIVTVKPAPESTDLLFMLKINDFEIKGSGTGFSSANVEARVLLDVTVADSKGAQIWKKTVVSSWKSKRYNPFSTKECETAIGTVVVEATASAVKDAVRGMFMSRVVKDYLAGKGERKIIASKSSQEKAFKLPPPRSDTYAIVIGIDYQDRKDIPHLQYASNDARQVYEVLTDPRYGGVPKENAILLLNERATRNQMMVALRKIRDRDGYVYVYYSGHGAPKTKGDKFIDAYLVPDNAIITDPEALEDTSIKMSYLQKLMDASRAKGIMVALDACFSGGGKSIVPKGGKP
ncbi:MAG: caspase family protein, partial [Deltaproteobacteria bacterium]|nr:caspase family protein [Deltaproteobacteria bacterium]